MFWILTNSKCFSFSRVCILFAMKKILIRYMIFNFSTININPPKAHICFHSSCLIQIFFFFFCFYDVQYIDILKVLIKEMWMIVINLLYRSEMVILWSQVYVHLTAQAITAHQQPSPSPQEVCPQKPLQFQRQMPLLAKFNHFLLCPWSLEVSLIW